MSDLRESASKLDQGGAIAPTLIPRLSPSVLLQAMRFPPKAYNKDLESAEVTHTHST